MFLRIYFVGGSTIELDRRCAIFTVTKSKMIHQLLNLLHEHNELVRLFKTVLDAMHSDDHKTINNCTVYTRLIGHIHIGVLLWRGSLSLKYKDDRRQKRRNE